MDELVDDRLGLRVFLGRDAVAEGFLTRDQLRGPSVRRALRGVYAPVGLRVDHLVRCEAAGLLMPPAAFLTGVSAARAGGVALGYEDDDVEIAVPESCRFGPIRGTTVRRVLHPRLDTRPWRTSRLAHPDRLAFDLAARTWPPLAVGYLDQAARAGLIDVPSARRHAAAIADNDVVAVRWALDRVDGRAESVPESVVRIVLLTAGVDTEPQVVVRHRGTFVARVDLAIAELRIAVEYDGAWHADRGQLERDRDRLNRLREAGWVVVSVTARTLRDPPSVVAAVQRAIAQRTSRA